MNDKISGGAIGLLVTLAVLGLVCWVLVTLVPMPHPFATIIIAVAVIIALVLVLRWAGIWT